MMCLTLNAPPLTLKQGLLYLLYYLLLYDYIIITIAILTRFHMLKKKRKEKKQSALTQYIFKSTDFHGIPEHYW